MGKTAPTRIDGGIFALAQVVADLEERSAAQQVSYWAKLGQQIEASGTISSRNLVEVLAGRRSYDDLNPHEQAVVRVEWADRIEARRAALDFAAAFTDDGRSFAELDDDGNVVIREPAPSA